ncbi:MAG: DUF3300 domain-containing protein [Amaricoccus sp.]
MRSRGAKLAAWITVGSLLGGSLSPAWSQEVGTDRLRAAIERAREGSTLTPASASSTQLDESALEDLAAPVALYPDALLAQVLVAATFPDQLADANQLIAASADMTDSELDSALREKQWDPSVLVLMSGFPSVVSRMADDPDWTRQLGEAMVDQDSDLLVAVQHLRAEAYANGALRSNQAQTVERQDDQIYIRPADPKVVYVPRYDPEVAFADPVPSPAPRPRAFADPFPASYAAPASTYAAPYTTPLITPAPAPSGTSTLETALVSGVVAFGAGLLVDQLFNNDHDNGGNDDWKGYWGGSRPIDWHGRQVYARPYPPGPRPGDGAWSWERDQYWDRQARRWRQDQIQDQQRQDFLRWVSVPPGGGDPYRGWHDGVRQSRAERDWYKAQIKADKQREKQAEKLSRQREKDLRAEQKQWEKLQERQSRDERERQKQWDARRDAQIQRARDQQRAQEALDAQRASDRQDARAEMRARERQQAREEQRALDKSQAREEARARERQRKEDAKQEQRARDRQQAREDQQAKQARRAAREQQDAQDQRAKQARQERKAKEQKAEDRQQQDAKAARREQQKAEKAQRQAEERRHSDEPKAEKTKRKPDCKDGKKDCKRTE